MLFKCLCSLVYFETLVHLFALCIFSFSASNKSDIMIDEFKVFWEIMVIMS